jgi:flagellar hook protein FlgE
MPSFSIPLTGLESDNTALNTIANNLSNMSTTGFKAQTTNFGDLLYQQFGASGSGDPIQVGTGVAVASTETDFSAGAVSGTGNSSDMAINGNGFFVINDGGTQELTQAGDFSVSSGGALLTAGGAQVLGYPATGGVVNTNASLTGINLPIGQVEAPNATTQLSITANLDAGSAIGTAVPAAAEIYDSLGVAHSASITFTKTASNTWSYSISLPTGDANAAANSNGSITFDSSGNPTSPVPAIANVTFSGLSDGASTLAFALNTQSASGASLITQVSGTSAVTNTEQDGYSSGEYNGFSVGVDGTVYAAYSNGNTAAVGQLAIADVGNQQGLEDVGANSYATTIASGQAAVGVAGSGGRGSIEDSSLEGSNVDISTEFSNLIVAQRAFEANSKAITTFDTVTQEAINMIH